MNYIALRCIAACTACAEACRRFYHETIGDCLFCFACMLKHCDRY
jgi:hypothetical protein